MEPNLAVSIYVRSSIKFIHFVPFHQQILPPSAILVSHCFWYFITTVFNETKIFLNLSIFPEKWDVQRNICADGSVGGESECLGSFDTTDSVRTSNTGTCFIQKIYAPSSSLLQGKHLPFTSFPLRLNIFRLFVILSLTQLYRYPPEIFLFSTATFKYKYRAPPQTNWTRIFSESRIF
jgi:hypothetical protein